MNIKEIEVLLDRFYEGETTLAEELMLREFFSGNQVPDSLRSHQAMFLFSKSESLNRITDPDFDKKVSDVLTGSGPDTGIVKMPPLRNRFFLISSVAAGLLLLAGLFFTIKHDIFSKKQLDILKGEQEIAYGQAREALLLVSVNLNTGLKQVGHLQTLGTAINEIQMLNKFYKYQTIIINPDEINDLSKKPE